jgi:hypothetical protein
MTENMVEYYFKILDLSSSATIDDVKKEFRLKAKQYHPDLNNSPLAQEKFIEINEAYEFLMNYFSVLKVRQRENSQWEHEQRKKARARAAYYAKKKYEDFESSKIYRSAIIMYSFFDVLFLVVGIAIMMVPFFISLENLELEAKIASIFAAVIAEIFGLMLTGATLYSLLARWQK